jgi:hypothetical protein
MFTMKKILTVFILSIIALSLTFSAFAADTGSFVQSPSANQAPELIVGGSDEHECDQSLIITSYADREKLSAEKKAELEAVYTKVKNTNNLTSVCGDLKALAEKLGIPTTNLSVSDLFDISDAHADAEGTFDIVLTADTLENFVGLLHYTDGKFELIDNAKIEEKDGELHLVFSTDGLSPFAIVVDNGEVAPVKDNGVLIGVLTVIAIAEGAALVAILVKFIVSKKFA